MKPRVFVFVDARRWNSTPRACTALWRQKVVVIDGTLRNTGDLGSHRVEQIRTRSIGELKEGWEVREVQS